MKLMLERKRLLRSNSNMSSAKDLLTKTQQEQIIRSIQQAEEGTAGEIRVHVEDSSGKEPLQRAEEVFLKLGMQKTSDRTGVLIYIAAKDHRFAIIGDKGIHQKVGSDFWEAEKELLAEYFSKGSYAEGLARVIGLIGEQLRQFFPQKQADKNELPDEISIK